MNAHVMQAPTTLPIPADATPRVIAGKADPYIVGATVLLVALGTVVVYSATAIRSVDLTTRSGDPHTTYFLWRHVVSVAFGLLGLTAALRVPVERWSRWAFHLLALAFVLLVAVFVPGIAQEAKNGATRWIKPGFQPAELAKLAVVVYLAHSLAKKRERVADFKVGFLPHVLTVGLVVGLLLKQPDFGTAVIVFACLGLMMFVAGTKVGYLLMAALLALPVGVGYVLAKPHAMARFMAFLDPEATADGSGFQLQESLIAFGSGGLTGTGLGAGHQKLGFLPEAHTDFIFAVVGEELGFVGVCAVLAAFAVLIGRAVQLARRASVRFNMFIAFGIASWLGAQALINMCVVTGLVPTKGLTLPLVSYGGSSMVMTLVAVGLLLRISAEERNHGALGGEG
jgi:cell division protein FtsW